MGSACGERSWSPRRTLLAALFLSALPAVSSYQTNRFFERHQNPKPRPPRWGPPTKRDGSAPLVISNLCEDTIWPGIGTQAGTGAGVGGFELASGSSQSFTVSSDWQGRVWGRTNCSFNVAGTGAAINNGAGAACDTGDCGGVLNCVNTVRSQDFSCSNQTNL
jgi:hypothetical protein